MAEALIPVDGAREHEGLALRTALALAIGTGQGFEMTHIGERRPQPGLRADHVAAVRAASLLCGAKVGGAFDRSPDLRFEPGPVSAGQFRFDLASADSATPLLQCLAVAAATGAADSRIEITGGTHVPASPSAHDLLRHWTPMLERLGLPVAVELRRAGFLPPGGGEMHARVRPWARPATELRLDSRGSLVGIRGLSVGARSKTDVAEKLMDAARTQLWESRRLEADWEVASVSAPSPGAFLMMEIEFERSRAAFSVVAERRVRPETLGAAVAGRVLKFLDGEAAVDPYLPDQIAVPLALGHGGGIVATSEITRWLDRVAEVLKAFGCPAIVSGRVGGPGHLEVPRW